MKEIRLKNFEIKVILKKLVYSIFMKDISSFDF